jgi:hypothetical protein
VSFDRVRALLDARIKELADAKDAALVKERQALVVTALQTRIWEGHVHPAAHADLAFLLQEIQK